MGQLMSSRFNRQNNNDLTNALVDTEFILSEDVEKAFRSVDRGFYFKTEEKHKAYRDSAYIMDKIHLSSPGIYAVALESLDLKKGKKFLNIGSGIGYFSTVAGLLLGETGVNHGIEIHQSLINLAYQKIDEFKLNAAAIDHFQFCEPVFIQGNACELLPVGYYDRVYCGAAIPAEQAEFMKSLIAIGGILVMPLAGSLVKITRLDDYLYNTDDVLDVAFTNLIVPNGRTCNTVKFPSVQPLSLQELCRSKIRSDLRDNLKEISPNLVMPAKCTSNDKETLDSLPFVRIQYDESVDGSVPNLHNIINSFVGLDDMLDSESTSSGEYDYDDSLSDSEEPDENLNETLDAASAQDTNEESTKRKSEEPGCSKQNHTSAEAENIKRIKMTSQNSKDVSSTSSQCDTDLWETISSTSRTSIFEGFEDSVDGDSNEGYAENDHDSISSNDTDDIIEESIIKKNKYNFIFEHNKNDLSKLLKAEIDSLQLPGLLKRFLNYNRTD